MKHGENSGHKEHGLNLEELSKMAGSPNIVRDIEERIARLEKSEQKTGEEIDDYTQGLMTDGEIYKDEEKGSSDFFSFFKPYIAPTVLTILALVLAYLFVFVLLKRGTQEAPRAITNVGLVENVEKPEIETVFVEEPEIEVEPELEPEPVKAGFSNGTSTIINVRFSYNKYTYDTHPNGMYLKGEQLFEGDYEGYKILATNRAFANDYMFGVDRQKVSLIGSCSFVIDNAKVAIEDMTDSENDQSYDLIGKKYFRGVVTKVVESDEPRIDCKSGEYAGENY